MSEPNYGQNGWALWRGDVTATLRALEEGQHRIETALKEKDDRTSGRIGRVEKDISGVHERVTDLNNKWNIRVNAALGTAVLLLLGWIVTLIEKAR